MARATALLMRREKWSKVTMPLQRLAALRAWLTLLKGLSNAWQRVGTFGRTQGPDPNGQHYLRFPGPQECLLGSGWLSNPWAFT